MATETKAPRRKKATPDAAIVLETLTLPACCPKCKGTELRLIDGAPNIDRPELAGEIKGFAYKGILWEARRCAACGQNVKTRTYFPAK
jgi:hypothetical protein